MSEKQPNTLGRGRGRGRTDCDPPLPVTDSQIRRKHSGDEIVKGKDK